MKTCAGIEEKSRGKAFGRKRRIRIVRIPRSSIPNKTEYQTGSRKNSEKVLTPFAPKKFIPRNPLNGNHTDRNTTKHQKCRRNQERNQGHGERSREEDEEGEELEHYLLGWVGGEARGTESQAAEDAAQQPKSSAKTMEATPFHLSLSHDSAPERERRERAVCRVRERRETEDRGARGGCRKAAERRCDLQLRRQQPFRPLWPEDEQGSLSAESRYYNGRVAGGI